MNEQLDMVIPPKEKEIFENGITIDGLHTFHDFGLIMTGIGIGNPEQKTNYLSIPGRNGDLDFSDSQTGSPRFGNRTLEFSFIIRDKDTYRWQTILSDLTNLWHNRSRKIVIDTDGDYFYKGRIQVESEKNYQGVPTFQLIVNAEPYKQTTYNSLDEWEWDTFDFEKGITREYRDIIVNGKETVLVEGSYMSIRPTIITDKKITLEIGNERYELAAGTNTIRTLWIREEHQEFIFIGHATVSIEYRWGSL